MPCGRWSCWHFIGDLFGNGRDVPKESGVYAIRYAPKGKPSSIPRVFRQDREGILCYGSGNLRDRLRGFHRAAAFGANPGHAEGERYWLLRYADNGYPLCNVQVRWRKCETRKEADDHEGALLNDYAKRYGETPPLNRQVPASG